MIKKLLLVGAASATMIGIVGCGGGGDPKAKEVTKVIMDDPIVGLGYTCSPSAPSEKKLTDEDGIFTCVVDDVVTFYLGEYEIGSANTSVGTADTMRIADLMDKESGAAVADVRQLLQTIDKDKGDEKITIPDDFGALDDVDVEPGDDGFDGNVTAELRKKNVIDEDEELVSEEEAGRHADEAYMKRLFAGKTFWTIDHDKTIDKIKISADLTKLTYTEENGKSEDINITIDPLGQYLVGDFKFKIVAVDEKKITIKMWDREYDLYTTDDAAAAANEASGGGGHSGTTTQAETNKDLLAGKTFYAAEIGNKCDDVNEVVVNSEATELAAEGKTKPLSFQGNIVILEDGGDEYNSTIEAEDDYIEFKGFNKRLYYKKADAEAYVKSLGECSGEGGSGSATPTEAEVSAALLNKTLYRAHLCDDQMSVEKIEMGENTFSFDDGESAEIVKNTPFAIAGNTVDFDNGGNIVQVTLITEISVTFHDSKENDDHVWYYSREDATDHANACNGGSEGGSDDNGSGGSCSADDGTCEGTPTEAEVKAALLNKTLYRVKHCEDGTSITHKVVFAEDTFDIFENDKVEEKGISFAVSGNAISFIFSGENEVLEVVAITSSSVTFKESEDDEGDVYYYSLTDAEAHAETCSDEQSDDNGSGGSCSADDGTCEGGSTDGSGGGGSAGGGSTIAITQEMLSGKTFYLSDTDGEGYTSYIKAEVVSTTQMRSREIHVDSDGTIISDESLTSSYTVTDGKWVFAPGDHEDGVVLELKETTDTAWIFVEGVMYLSKPANYPASL